MFNKNDKKINSKLKKYGIIFNSKNIIKIIKKLFKKV